ncbi:MAG TPA: hypothetical protein VG889_01155 [Rhizomicrobium sp.]|nr:hypothetical protein [Rhizomicrobium sp.]
MSRLFVSLLASIACLMAPIAVQARWDAGVGNQRTGLGRARYSHVAPTAQARRALPARPAQFTIVDAPGAGTARGQGTMVVYVDASSVAAGSYIDADGYSHGFLRAPDGTFTVFDADGPHGDTSVEWMSEAGEIAGTCIDPSSHLRVGFRRGPAGTIRTFAGSSGGSAVVRVISLNRRGEIVGNSLDSNSVSRGFFRLKDGTITQFDAPGAASGSTLVSDVNAAGTITGPYVDANSVAHGFLRFADGTFAEFDVPGGGTAGGQGTSAIGLNKNGWVTGAYFDSSSVSHGFVRDDDGNFTTFDAPGASPRGGTSPVELNVHGQVTGSFYDARGVERGFVRSRGGSIVEFDAPGGGSASIVATTPYDINQYGVVAGWDWDNDGVYHGFLRSPD